MRRKITDTASFCFFSLMKNLFTFISAVFLSATQIFAGEGLVKIAAGCIRATPSHSSELVSQAVMGTPLRLLDNDSGWWLVETPEGYQGYMISTSVQPLDSMSMHRWRESPRIMFTDIYTGRILSTDSPGTPISDIHAGSVLEVTGYSPDDSIDVKMPDGRRGRLSSGSTTPLGSMGTQEPDTDAVITMARALMGTSYLWGGTTPAAMDCSGLAKICYLNQGIILQRDASQQAVTGKILGTDYNEYRKGDLVFFKSAATGNIVHVGIYDHDGLYVHSSGRVKVNSLDPESPLYIPSNILASACRITGNIGTPGITPITCSRAYFNIKPPVSLTAIVEELRSTTPHPTYYTRLTPGTGASAPYKPSTLEIVLDCVFSLLTE